MNVQWAGFRRLPACALAFGAAALLVAARAPSASAAELPEKVLHSFCAQPGCADGAVPKAGLIMDAGGNLYGTTQGYTNGLGAPLVYGNVFRLTPNATKTAWGEKTLYGFCQTYNCGDGALPAAGLVLDGYGNLYGTALGFKDLQTEVYGHVFELTPNAAKTVWTEKVIYPFCASANCVDGAHPSAGLIRDAQGNLYGTTSSGGAHGAGAVFKLKRNAAGTAWKEQVLYSFCRRYSPATGCVDGATPNAGLIRDAAGNLFGTTSQGGRLAFANGAGLVFELTPNAAKTAWTEKTVYAFCGVAKCIDGATPNAGLIIDGVGNLYGTASGGGAGKNGGVVFKLKPNAAKTAWTENVLWSFCKTSGCPDGAAPYAGVIRDGVGNLYGTTSAGGNAVNGGVAFELTLNTAKTAWTEKVLYTFCRRYVNSVCLDGYAPFAGLIRDAAGNLYGTTSSGGAKNEGVAFALSK